jgi:hypothetical protein
LLDPGRILAFTHTKNSFSKLMSRELVNSTAFSKRSGETVEH